MQRSNALSVQSGVFCEALQIFDQPSFKQAIERGPNLANEHRHTPIFKIAYGRSVLVQIPTGESLISAIEEGVVSLLDENICQLLPLFRSRIYASRVMRACMEKEDRARDGCG